MTIDEINTIRLALDTPENNRHYIKHTTDAKIILEKHKAAINYTRCCTELKGLRAISFEDWLIHSCTRINKNLFTFKGINYNAIDARYVYDREVKPSL